MKYIILVLCTLYPVATYAMQALDDAGLSVISGQSGITIDINPETADGTFLTASEVVLTENDKDGLGDETISLSDLKLRIVQFDASDNIIGKGNFNTVIDVDNTGQVLMRADNLPGLSFTVGDIKFGDRSVGSIGLNKWKFAPGSFLETAFVPAADGTKIRSRIVMTENSFLDFVYKEDGLSLSTKIEFKPNSANEPFDSEFFLSGVGGALRLEAGTVKGTLELTNIQILDENNQPLFSGASFGDIGLGDVSVNKGYFELAANTDPGVEGLKGRFGSDLVIGTVFYRTNNQRFNIRDIKLKTGAFNGPVEDIGYRFEVVGGTGAYGNGVSAVFFDATKLSFQLSRLTFSDKDGSNESASFGSFGIENGSFNGGSLTTSIWALPGAGRQGIRMDVELSDGASFDFTIKEDPAVANTPTLTASAVIGDFSSETHIDMTKKGFNTSVVDFEMSANINALKMGTGQTYQGQSGRIVVDNYKIQPGSYMRIEPVQ